MSLVVGLTGGIGSGKTTVADRFAELGAAVVDTDVIAHQLTSVDGAAIPAIRAEFGDTVITPDQRLDRAAMRRLAFAEPSARKRLESILHPLIRERSAALCEAQTTAPYVILVVPLLVESAAFRGRVDRILVVDCDEALQEARVMARSGLAHSEVRAIMATQVSRSERLAAADDVIANNNDLSALVANVLALHRRYLALASTRTIGGKLNADC